MLNNDSNGHTLKKNVVFTTGGKGGVGKTGVTLAIGDWYQSRQIPFLPLDLAEWPAELRVCECSSSRSAYQPRAGPGYEGRPVMNGEE